MHIIIFLETKKTIFFVTRTAFAALPALADFLDYSFSDRNGASL